VALFGKNVHRAADIRSAETRPSEFGDREGLVSVSFLITQARSTDERVRNDVADCNHAGNRDSECNDHSDRGLHDLASHGQSPSIGCNTCGAHAVTMTEP
jgi:hypothetical protein